MPYASNIHVAAYQVLDDVLVRQVPPPGAKATIHSIIDDLNAAHAPRPMIDLAERMSVQLQFLELATFHGNAAQVDQVRKHLKSIAADWINYRIHH